MKQLKPNQAPSTDRERYALDPTRRWPTRHRGISYRLSRDLTRTYAVYWKGKHLQAGATEAQALAKQAELRRSAARGERPLLPSNVTFAELANEWIVSKSRLRRRTIDYYRASLDLVLIPRFGNWRIAAIDADAVASLIRDLEREGLHAIDHNRKKRPLGRSSIENYLKPLHGVLSLAVRRGLIAANPIDHLTQDERPKREERQRAHEWTDDEVRALLDASVQLSEKPESRYDYSPLLRLVTRLGLRIGEVLGLQWQDFEKDDGALYVRRQWTRFGEYGPTKTRAGVRRIALPSDLRDELIALRLRSGHSNDEDPIFSSREGTPLGHRNLTKRGFEPARDLAGLPSSLTFHDLRHASASRLIHAGLDVVTVADIQGHADPNVTLKVYAHIYDRKRKDEAVRLALAGGAG